MDFANTRINKIVLTILIVCLGFLPILCLTSCSPVDPEWVVNNLFPNLWVFISHVLSAGILISVMTWLVWKPAKKTLQKRHDYIAKQIADAEKSKEAASMELAEANQLKVDALSQAMTIKTKAQADALGIIEQAKSDAQVEAQKLKVKAQEDILREKQEIQDEAQEDIINIAFDVAGSILNKEVDKQDRDKYIDELLSSISEDLKKAK